jgi:hypothetical protein
MEQSADLLAKANTELEIKRRSKLFVGCGQRFLLESLENVGVVEAMLLQGKCQEAVSANAWVRADCPGTFSLAEMLETRKRVIECTQRL